MFEKFASTSLIVIHFELQRSEKLHIDHDDIMQCGIKIKMQVIDHVMKIFWPITI